MLKDLEVIFLNVKIIKGSINAICAEESVYKILGFSLSLSLDRDGILTFESKSEYLIMCVHFAQSNGK